MCHRAVRREPYALGHIPGHRKTQKMCEKTVEKDPYWLGDFPDYFNT